MSDELAELKARYDRLNALYQVGSVIHTTLEPQEALQLILNQAVELMRAEIAPVCQSMWAISMRAPVTNPWTSRRTPS